VKHAFGLDIPLTLEDVCNPRRLALVVYDMQVGIVSQIANAAQVTSAVVAVLDTARGAGVRVFFTRHMSLPNEVAGTSQLRTAVAWQHAPTVARVKPAFPRDSAQFELVPDVSPAPTEAIFDKIAMSAFVGTPLEMALRDCRIEAFAIVGIAMEIGIEPTVRHGIDLGFLPVVVTDACGAGHPEAAERELATLRFTGGSIETQSATIRSALASSTEPKPARAQAQRKSS
jgi:nicotinamidase-related amidase